jgi:4-amino-4-deoxy-L-arabinose transferase-like glycosyltransferase
MNPVVLYFASGESLYPGAAIILVAIAISPLLERRWLLRFRNVSVWFALTMVVMACPPFSWAVDVVFLSAFLFWYFAVNLSALRKARGLTSAILATFR